MMTRKRWMAVALMAWAAGLAMAHAGEFAKLEVHPAQATVLAGEVVRFTVVARRADGSMATPPKPRWKATGGKLFGEGSYLAGEKAGTYAVTVGWEGLAAAAEVRVVLPPLPEVARLEIKPETLKLAVGHVRQVRATAYGPDGKPARATLTWKAAGDGRISTDGLFQAIRPGAAEVVVTVRHATGEMTATAKVTGTRSAAPVTMLQIRPTRVTLVPGEPMPFGVVAYDLSMRQVPCHPVWTATGGTVSARGMYTPGETPGTYQVTASDPGSGIKATAAVTIVKRPPQK